MTGINLWPESEWIDMGQVHLVRISEIIHWLARGWIIEHDLGDCGHGAWSILMKAPE